MAIADDKKAAPDEIASDMQIFSAHWLHEARKLEDVCRQRRSFPNVFFTVAPAEWTFPLHDQVLGWARGAKRLSETQATLTYHIYNVIVAILEQLLGDTARLQSVGIAAVAEYSMRFEFQNRGTLHVHVLLWAELSQDMTPERLTSKSKEEHATPLVRLPENLFKSSGRCAKRRRQRATPSLRCRVCREGLRCIAVQT